MIQVRQDVLEKMNTREVMNRLVYEFGRDLRTIRRWISENNPMLTTPMCVRAVSEELNIPQDQILTEEIKK